MTLDEFKLLAKGMKSAYTSPNFLPDEYSFKVWYGLLKDLPYKVVSMAVEQYIVTNRFPPTIADIRESATAMISEKPKSWDESWKWVCRCISLYGLPNESKAYEDMDEYTREAVKRMGWRNLCLSQNVSADRANYRMSYENIVKEKMTEQSLPEGLRLKLKDTNHELLGIEDD